MDEWMDEWWMSGLVLRGGVLKSILYPGCVVAFFFL